MTQQALTLLMHVDWHDMPADPSCPNWGPQPSGHLGPCHTCAACWLAANQHALKQLAALAQAQAGAGSVFALSGNEQNPDQGGEAL